MYKLLPYPRTGQMRRTTDRYRSQQILHFNAHDAAGHVEEEIVRILSTVMTTLAYW